MGLGTHDIVEKLDLYPRCYKQENAATLQDICSKCPIPSIISRCLPRIKDEIETQRQGNTPNGFIRYCEQALDNHVKKAAQFANDLANPAKNKSLDIGQALEIKFWNLALCELYKTELSGPNSSPQLKSIPLVVDTYESTTTAAISATPTEVAGPFASLLLNYTLSELTTLLQKLGLLDVVTEQATTVASPGAWVGTIHGLLDAKSPRLRSNKAAIQRAFSQVFGAVVGERAVQAGPGKRGSEAERFRGKTLELLNNISAD